METLWRGMIFKLKMADMSGEMEGLGGWRNNTEALNYSKCINDCLPGEWHWWSEKTANEDAEVTSVISEQSRRAGVGRTPTEENNLMKVHAISIFWKDSVCRYEAPALWFSWVAWNLWDLPHASFADLGMLCKGWSCCLSDPEEM